MRGLIGMLFAYFLGKVTGHEGEHEHIPHESVYDVQNQPESAAPIAKYEGEQYKDIDYLGIDSEIEDEDDLDFFEYSSEEYEEMDYSDFDGEMGGETIDSGFYGEEEVFEDFMLDEELYLEEEIEVVEGLSDEELIDIFLGLS